MARQWADRIVTRQETGEQEHDRNGEETDRINRRRLPEELQAALGRVISGYQAHATKPVQVLEIGCGDGVTSATILSSRKDCLLIALDSEEKMIKQARTNLREVQDNRWQLVLSDAVTYL